jgi:four helix bundle protein
MGFDAHDVAKEILDEVKPLVPRVKIHDAGLAKQLREAAQSILLNLGEGNRRLAGDRVFHFSVAAGSAGETLDAIDVAVAWGYVAADEVVRVRGLLDRELAMLWRLTHSR